MLSCGKLILSAAAIWLRRGGPQLSIKGMNRNKLRASIFVAQFGLQCKLVFRARN